MSENQSSVWKKITSSFTQQKPDVIKEIEKIIGKKLKSCPSDANILSTKQKRCYLLNKREQVTGLNLCDSELTNCDFLKALPNLTHLMLWRNKISDISILKVLPNLIHIDFQKNEISDIRVLKALPNLSDIDLRQNKISELPEWLLDLNIPIKLSWDTHDSIFLEGNPIIQPPLEIIKQGNEAIHAYFEQLKKEGSDTIYEAKLILVGEGGAGKTSLANKIINPNWQLIPETKSESTKGIDILSYSFPYKDKTFRVNIWDFGGQEIYHQTHQFFLSKRALYFLLTDDRKEDTDFYHWLNIVDLLSANSPVLIIKNEKSNRSRDIPEQELKEFNNIQKILSTDLSDNRGLPEIVRALQYYITDLPHIGSPLPKTWVKVREQLDQLAKQKNSIDLKEYFEICQANGFEKEANELQLSGYLHDLGVCLHFQNDAKSPLYKMLILKPTWATDAVYKVLDNDTVKKQAGHFNDKDLADIWQDEQYNTIRGELLALMQKFKLCYEIPRKEKHYIAPQLLKDKAPQYNWQTNNNLLLRYKYDFMPKGILSQFIVEMHEYIANNYQWVWKSGIILEKDKTQAEIIEYYGKREIHIRVHGNNKKELLNIVSYELDKINSSYERLKDKCKKLIPCNCEKCHDTQEPHFYDYEKLKERITHRKYTIECGNPPYADVDILKLAEDIDLKDFKNQLGLATKQTIINIETGDKTMTGENRTIHSTNYIEGNVSGGNIAGRDINIQNKSSMSKEEFLKLLQALKEDLPNSGLPADELESINSDIDAVENQVKKEKPSKSIVSNKLNGVNGMLDDISQTMETAEKGKEVFEKVVDTVKFLVSAIATASFFL
jgi:GTPase SAR1 family protein